MATSSDTPPRPPANIVVRSKDDAKKSWLDCVTDALEKVFAPAMPWLFLTLRRALIPTVCLNALAVLFYGVPQSSEVLFGLTEPVTHTVKRSGFASSVNFYPLLWYVVWSVLVSVSVWYSARLLCTVEARIGMPVAWKIRKLRPRATGMPTAHPGLSGKRNHDERRIKFAIRWLPRAYGVAALGAAMGALIFATLTVSALRRGSALGLVALSIGGPLLIAAGILGMWGTSAKRTINDSEDLQCLRLRRLWRTASVIAIVVGIICYAISAKYLLEHLQPPAVASPRAVYAVDLICAILPAFLLAGLVLRRKLLRFFYLTMKKRRLQPGRWLGHILFLPQPPFTYDQFESDHELTFEEVFPQVLAFILLGAVGLFCLGDLSVKHVRSLGSAGTILSFLAGAVVFITGAQLFLRRISRAVPGLTSAIVIVLFIVLQLIAVEPLGSEKIKPPYAESGAQSANPERGKRDTATDDFDIGNRVGRFVKVTAAQPDEFAATAQHYGHVIVNAYGGGLRAAIYTAQVLALADDATCGEFGKRIHAMSGVSGGSVGIAVYLVARQMVVEKKLYQDCVPGNSTRLTDSPGVRIVVVLSDSYRHGPGAVKSE